MVKPLEDWGIWWNTVQDQIELATGLYVPDKDRECFAPAHAAGRCPYEVARAYAEDIKNGETL